MEQNIYRMERPMERLSLTVDAKPKGEFTDSNVKPQQQLIA